MSVMLMGTLIKQTFFYYYLLVFVSIFKRNQNKHTQNEISELLKKCSLGPVVAETYFT